ncbi:MAG: hypothetical protein P4L59_04805 [Desulfosporosinus sp.]|nr:hypothetical protein [Desulfosporosinus sp.]
MIKKMFIKVTPVVDDTEGDTTLLALTIPEGKPYEVGKVVFFQHNLKTGKEDWVVFPKEYWADSYELMKEFIDAEYERAKADPNYSGEEYQKIISSTRKKMAFQEG